MKLLHILWLVLYQYCKVQERCIYVVFRFAKGSQCVKAGWKYVKASQQGSIPPARPVAFSVLPYSQHDCFSISPIFGILFFLLNINFYKFTYQVQLKFLCDLWKTAIMNWWDRQFKYCIYFSVSLCLSVRCSKLILCILHYLLNHHCKFVRKKKKKNK